VNRKNKNHEIKCPWQISKSKNREIRYLKSFGRYLFGGWPKSEILLNLADDRFY